MAAVATSLSNTVTMTPSGDHLVKIETGKDDVHVIAYILLSSTIVTALKHGKQIICVSCNFCNMESPSLYVFMKQDGKYELFYGILYKNEKGEYDVDRADIIVFDKKFRLKGNGFCGSDIAPLYQHFITRHLSKRIRNMQCGKMLQCVEKSPGRCAFLIKDLSRCKTPGDYIPFEARFIIKTNDGKVVMEDRPLHCDNCHHLITYNLTSCRCEQLRCCSEECRKEYVASSKHICKKCMRCGTAPVDQKCGGCESVWYCDRVCQREHWETHKPICRKLISQKEKQ